MSLIVGSTVVVRSGTGYYERYSDRVITKVGRKYFYDDRGDQHKISEVGYSWDFCMIGLEKRQALKRAHNEYIDAMEQYRYTRHELSISQLVRLTAIYNEKES